MFTVTIVSKVLGPFGKIIVILKRLCSCFPAKTIMGIFCRTQHGTYKRIEILEKSKYIYDYYYTNDLYIKEAKHAAKIVLPAVKCKIPKRTTEANTIAVFMVVGEVFLVYYFSDGKLVYCFQLMTIHGGENYL